MRIDLALIVAAAALCVAGAAVAQNECATAAPVVAGVNGPFANVAATDSVPAWPCGAGSKDVWYAYVAGATGTTIIDTCGATFDTILQVFDGAGGCGALTSLGCNDDACGLQSSLTLSLTAGTLYYIRVGGFAGATGMFPLRIGLVGDECASATAVVNGANGPFSNVGFSTSAPAWSCAPAGTDRWFAYVASCTGTLTVDTCSADFDTTLEFFAGGCGALTSFGCNDDAGSGACAFTLQSSVSVPVTSGSTYYIRVGGFSDATGSFSLAITCAGAGVPNDECGGALAVVAGVNGPYSNAGATTSSPWPCAAGGSDIWFVYTASCCGTLTADTCAPGGTFDTAIEVLTGGCGGLVSLGCDDDTCGFGSSVSVPVVTGFTYHIRIGGFGGATGSCSLTLACAPVVPANDECAGAIPVALGTNGPFANFCATTSAPAWPCGTGGADVWFRFVASCTAPHTFLTCGADYDTMIQVFAGGCGGLVSLGCNDDAGPIGPCALSLRSRLQVNLVAGTTYYIRVGGFAASAGSFPLEILAGTGLGTIALTTPSTCPFPGSFAVAGDPNLGGNVNASIGGATGLPFISFGFAPAQLLPGCPCRILSVQTSWQFTTSLNLFIPCVGAFIGTPLQVQGAELFPATPPSCAIPVPNHFTDVYTITIG